MRLVTVTTFFPNTADRQRAVFVEHLVRALQRLRPVEVVSPVPWAPPLRRVAHWYAQSRIPRQGNVDGIAVGYPRFLVLPKLGWLSGLTYCLGILPTLARLKRRHGKLLLHAHCAYPDAVGVALAARLLRLPYVVTAHGSDINVYAEQPALRPQIAWTLSHARGVVAVSGLLAGKIAALTGGRAVQRCIPCAGYDPALFGPQPAPPARVALGLPQEARVVLFVGLLVSIKAVEFLVEAWARLASEGRLRDSDRLVLVGDGPCRAALERQAAEAGVTERVLFAGMRPHSEVARWVAAATLLCLPSRNEGTPNVVVEALASGRPVVASRVGGIPDLVHDGENGQLAPAADATALANALELVMNRDWDEPRIRESVAHLTWPALARQNIDFMATLNRDFDDAPAA